MVKSKVGLAKEYHIAPSEVDRMIFFEYEYLLEEINVLQKQQEEQNISQQKEYESMKHSMSHPKMPDMKMPSFTMPQITMPKF